MAMGNDADVGAWPENINSCSQSSASPSVQVLHGGTAVCAGAIDSDMGTEEAVDSLGALGTAAVDLATEFAAVDPAVTFPLSMATAMDDKAMRALSCLPATNAVSTWPSPYYFAPLPATPLTVSDPHLTGANMHGTANPMLCSFFRLPSHTRT